MKINIFFFSIFVFSFCQVKTSMNKSSNYFNTFLLEPTDTAINENCYPVKINLVFHNSKEYKYQFFYKKEAELLFEDYVIENNNNKYIYHEDSTMLFCTYKFGELVRMIIFKKGLEKCVLHKAIEINKNNEMYPLFFENRIELLNIDDLKIKILNGDIGKLELKSSPKKAYNYLYYIDYDSCSFIPVFKYYFGSKYIGTNPPNEENKSYKRSIGNSLYLDIFYYKLFDLIL